MPFVFYAKSAEGATLVHYFCQAANFFLVTCVTVAGRWMARIDVRAPTAYRHRQQVKRVDMCVMHRS